jgi:dipeptidyl aminopeptidase/acylaminoacyl peptidase
VPRQTLPYGSWPSPITTDLLLADITDLAMPRVDGDDVYWLAGRPSDGGRVAVIRRTPDGAATSLTPAPFNVRSRVHEYGGGAYGVSGGIVVFANFADTRLYRLDVNEPATGPTPITPEGPHRYAQPAIDLPRRQVIAVREDHTDPAAPVNTLVTLALDGGNDDGGRVIVSGTDFVAWPGLSADGEQLAWMTWDLPEMPWDGSTVWRATLDADGVPVSTTPVTDGTTWVQQPRWTPEGLLAFIEEAGEWASLAVVDPASGDAPLRFGSEGLEFGAPNWFLDAHDYDFLPDGRIVAIALERAVARLVVIDPRTGSCTVLDADPVPYAGLAVAADGSVVMSSVTATTPPALTRLSLPAPGVDQPVTTGVIRSSTSLELDAAGTSVAQPVIWTNSRGQTVHGFYLPPKNADVEAPPDERPPLLVVSHGGPTGVHFATLNLGFQFWTSRGFAILDVNYGGSTGFGRSYRKRLTGQWGVVDVDDCVTGAVAMADQGLADRARLAIRGGSAGGYTTLRALTESDVFAAGASHYGVGDLEALAKDTHKLESRYLDSLIGPYPESRDLYVERSPIHHPEQLSSPMILLQGADDQVVPPSQAEDMAAALRDKGLPVALLVFEGEGHGFRQAANVKRALEAELYFYGRVLGFTPADQLDPVEITNLP